MRRYGKPKGWRHESHRHYLAAKGVKTKRYFYTPTYTVGDFPLIAGDAVGTAGASVIPWIPVAVPVLIAYGGASYLKKRKDKTGSYFADRHSARLSKALDGMERYNVMSPEEIARERHRVSQMSEEEKARAVQELDDTVKYAEAVKKNEVKVS